MSRKLRGGQKKGREKRGRRERFFLPTKWLRYNLQEENLKMCTDCHGLLYGMMLPLRSPTHKPTTPSVLQFYTHQSVFLSLHLLYHYRTLPWVTLIKTLLNTSSLKLKVKSSWPLRMKTRTSQPKSRFPIHNRITAWQVENDSRFCASLLEFSHIQ